VTLSQVDTQDVGTFVADLVQELRDKRLTLLDTEFLAAVEAGTAKRPQIAAWAKAFHAATRNGRVGLGNFYANSPDDSELRADIAANLYEEETGRISGVNRCHAHVFYDLLAACGVSREEADAAMSPVGPPYPPQGRRIEPKDYFVELSAYGLNVEVPNAEFCVRIARALRDHYGFSDDALTWFTMHAHLDAGHGEEFRKYAARAAEYPSGLERVRAATLQMAPGVQIAWDGFGVWKAD
jgi:pyrroloquinoline quinone (PQQ) biosynthesis protein C